MPNASSIWSFFLLSILLTNVYAQQGAHNVSVLSNKVFSCGVCVCQKQVSQEFNIQQDVAINCSAKGLENVPVIRLNFPNGSRVISLDLSYNLGLSAHVPGNETEQTICQAYPDLLSLSLAFIELEDLPGFIEGCGKLQSLDLGGNQLTSLGAGDLDELRGLRRLVGLTVGHIQTTSFLGLRHLEELTLEFSGRRLRRVIFARNFHNLTLHGQKVRKLPPKFWSGFRNLTSLDLWLPQLNKLDGTLPAEIQQLSLRGIKSLKPDQLKHMTNLNTLKIAESQHIADLLLPSTSKLRVFEVHTCLLSELPQQWKGSLENLESLCLRQNELDSIHTNLPYLSKLRYLDMSHNFISDLEPGSLDGFTQLETIDMSNNDLEKVRPGVLSHLPNLETVIFSRNYLDEWQPGHMRSLRFLDLSSNYLSYLNISAPQLTTLDLSENEFECFPPSLYKSNLSVVKIRGNDLLSAVSGTALCGIDTLSFVDLSGAQLTCSCEVRALGLCNQKVEVRGHCDQYSQNLSALVPCELSTTSVAPNTTEAEKPRMLIAPEARVSTSASTPTSTEVPRKEKEESKSDTQSERVSTTPKSVKPRATPLYSHQPGATDESPEEDDPLQSQPSNIFVAIMGTAGICLVIVLFLVGFVIWWRVKRRVRRHESTEFIDIDRNISNTTFGEGFPLIRAKLVQSLKSRGQAVRSIEYTPIRGYRNIFDIVHVASVPSSSTIGRKPLIIASRTDVPALASACGKIHDIETPPSSDIAHSESFSGFDEGLVNQHSCLLDTDFADGKNEKEPDPGLEESRSPALESENISTKIVESTSVTSADTIQSLDSKESLNIPPPTPTPDQEECVNVAEVDAEQSQDINIDTFHGTDQLDTQEELIDSD